MNFDSSNHKQHMWINQFFYHHYTQNMYWYSIHITLALYGKPNDRDPQRVAHYQHASLSNSIQVYDMLQILLTMLNFMHSTATEVHESHTAFQSKIIPDMFRQKTNKDNKEVLATMHYRSIATNWSSLTWMANKGDSGKECQKTLFHSVKRDQLVWLGLVSIAVNFNKVYTEREREREREREKVTCILLELK